MNEALSHLQRDLFAIRKRGARPISMQVTPELLHIAAVEYHLFEVKPNEPTPVPSIYGVPFEMVATLPSGLLYSIAASDDVHGRLPTKEETREYYRELTDKLKDDEQARRAYINDLRDVHIDQMHLAEDLRLGRIDLDEYRSGMRIADDKLLKLSDEYSSRFLSDETEK